MLWFNSYNLERSEQKVNRTWIIGEASGESRYLSITSVAQPAIVDRGSRPAAQRWGWALQYYYVDQVYLIPTKDDSADQAYWKQYY
jgi:hypothetical protein